MSVYCKCKHKLIKTKKEEGRKASPNSQQRKCNWLEGTSLSLGPPIMSQITYNTHGWQLGHESRITGWLTGSTDRP